MRIAAQWLIRARRVAFFPASVFLHKKSRSKFLCNEHPATTPSGVENARRFTALSFLLHDACEAVVDPENEPEVNKLASLKARA
jgi:hypothetical protein